MRGCRTESLYGSKERELIAVVKHEMEELGNTDIRDYITGNHLPGANKKKVFSFLRQLKKKGFSECVWLCRNVKELFSAYPPHDEEESYEVDEYSFVKGDYQIISDLEEGGRLVAFKDVKVRTIGFINKEILNIKR